MKLYFIWRHIKPTLAGSLSRRNFGGEVETLVMVELFGSNLRRLLWTLLLLTVVLPDATQVYSEISGSALPTVRSVSYPLEVLIWLLVW